MTRIETADIRPRPESLVDLWAATFERVDLEIRAKERSLHDMIVTHGNTPEEYRSACAPVNADLQRLRQERENLAAILDREAGAKR